MIGILLLLAVTIGGGYVAVRFLGLPSWRTFVVGAVACLVLVPTVSFANARTAHAAALRYREWWNGWELSVSADRTPCTRDGSCDHTYDCDPYTVTEVVTNADGKGTHLETRTKYHSCPEATEEWTYAVATTLGRYTLADHVFAEHPAAWRAGHGLPSGVLRGPPALWTAAQARVAGPTGHPGPVTARRGYDNYILASQHTLLHAHAADLRRWRSRLPRPASTLMDAYDARKVYDVGSRLGAPGIAAWTAAVSLVNADLGSTRQGDLHVVLTRVAKGDADSFTQALLAYWQSPELGRDAVSKNAVIVVLGEDPSAPTVAWARIGTGMPTGNEALIAAADRVVGSAFSPASVLGAPAATLVRGKVTVDRTGLGPLGRLLFDQPGFRRVCLVCKDEHRPGFKYLSGEIPMSTGRRAVGAILALAACGVAWTALFLYAHRDYPGSRPDGWWYGQLPERIPA